MIEIVFTESAWGSLLFARPTGNKNDAYGFDLGLSVGDIARDDMGPGRYEILCRLCGFRPEEWGLEHKLEQAETALPEVLRRSSEGEPVRLWYSDQPDEICGFYWMLARLEELKEACGPISAVKLPRYVQRDDHTMVEHTSWGEVAPEEWHEFLPLEQPVSPIWRRACWSRWRDLQEENAPLRAVLNGQLVSAPEDFYDSFIRRELGRMENAFREAQLIGNVIGRCQLGIGDGVIARRIDAMVESGELEVVTLEEESDRLYRRVLRKGRA